MEEQGASFNPKNIILNVKHRSCNIMSWGYFAGKGSGAHHNIDGILRKEDYLEILMQHLKTSAMPRSQLI